MEKGTLKYIDSDTTVHEIFSTTDAELVSYDNNGTDTTVANFLDNLSFDTAETADVAEKAEKDLSGNVITSTYAPKNSPNFTGTPTAPTASDLDLLTNQVATVAWCNNVFKRFTGIVPENMDTLQEFWDALGHDSDLATTLSTELAKKQDKTDKLTAFSNLTLSADKLILATGENSFSTTALTSTGKSIISSYTDKDIRKALGVYKHLIYDECENVWYIGYNPQISGGKLVLDGEAFTCSDGTFNLGGSNSFTFEWEVSYSNSITSSETSAQQYCFGLYGDDDNRFHFTYFDTDRLRFFWKNNAAFLDATNFVYRKSPVNSPRKIAISYDGSTVYWFVDGELVTSETATITQTNYKIYLGTTRNITAAQRLVGTIDEFRLSDICRHTQNFTPEERFEVDEHTLSLLHFD